MWIDNHKEKPVKAGKYRVIVEWSDIPYEEKECDDYFDGHDWDFYGYRQLIAKWWKE